MRSNERQLLQQRHLIDLSRDPIFVWEFDGAFLSGTAATNNCMVTPAKAVGKTKGSLLHTVVQGSSFAGLKAKLVQGRQLVGHPANASPNGIRFAAYITARLTGSRQSA
jgi:two-component system CheB/CheR fusion protein